MVSMRVPLHHTLRRPLLASTYARGTLTVRVANKPSNRRYRCSVSQSRKTLANYFFTEDVERHLCELARNAPKSVVVSLNLGRGEPVVSVVGGVSPRHLTRLRNKAAALSALAEHLNHPVAGAANSLLAAANTTLGGLNRVRSGPNRLFAPSARSDRRFTHGRGFYNRDTPR